MERVKVLNGGTLEWSAFNDMEKEPVEPKPGNLTLKPANPALLVEWADVYDDIVSRRDPNVVLLDARPHDMYTGEVIRHSIQGGHIPGEINVVSLNGTDAQSQKLLRVLLLWNRALPAHPTATRRRVFRLGFPLLRIALILRGLMR